MIRSEFDALSRKLKNGSTIAIHYRSNWRGGDGKPFNHRNGKKVQGTYEYVRFDGIKLREKDFPINYRAIKSIEILKEYEYPRRI